MNEPFIKSIDNIREESFGMLRTIRAIRGKDYARLVHAIILADQISNVADLFAEGASEDSKELAMALREGQLSMLAQVMRYLIRETGLPDDQVSKAFEDAKRIQSSTEELVGTAQQMSQSGKVIGE